VSEGDQDAGYSQYRDIRSQGTRLQEASEKRLILSCTEVSLVPDNTSAFHLLLTGDPALFSIVRLSLAVSLTAAVIAALIGMPLGALVALTRFRGREFVIVAMNALMGLPPVIVGLAVYLSLSRSGPLGSWGLLFTPLAMVMAQTIKHPTVKKVLGMEFIDYLISPVGQGDIASYKLDGQQLFYPDANDPNA